MSLLIAFLSVLTAAPLAMAQSDPFSQLVSEAYSIYTEATSVIASIATASPSSARTSSTTTPDSSLTSSSASQTSTSASAASSTSLASSSSTSASSTFSSSAVSSVLSSTTGQSSSSPVAAAASATSSSDVSNNSGNDSHRTLAIVLGSVLGALALGLLILVFLLCCRRRRRSQRQRSLLSDPISPSDEEVNSWRQSSHQNATTRTEMVDNNSVHHGVAPPLSDHPAFRAHENPFVPVPPPPRKTAPNSRAGLTDGMVPGDEPFVSEKDIGHSPAVERRSHDHSLKKDAAVVAGGALVGATAMHHRDKHNHDVKEKEMEIPDSSYGRAINRKPVPLGSSKANEPWSHDGIPPEYDANTFIEPSQRRSNESGRRSLSRDAARANAAFDQEYSKPVHSHSQDVAALGAGALAGAAVGHHGRSNKSHSPMRRPPVVPNTRPNESDSSDPSVGYSDALPYQPRHFDNGMERNSWSYDSPVDIPPPPSTRPRRNSMLGTAAPAAAAYSYHNGNQVPFPSRRRDLTPPTVPSRSPRRSRFSDVPFSDVDQPPIPSTAQDEDIMANYSQKGIVGDNGYPHMNVPRRKSGGEYDFTHGPLGPQSVKKNTNQPSPTEGSDDSTWRMSSGMPGGWQKDQSHRNSMDSGKGLTGYSALPRNSGSFPRPGDRDSTGNGVKRLRLADLRREEEEREMMARGRSEENGWNQFDNYDYHHGVGQAL